MEEIIQLLEQVESNLKARNYDKIVVASVVKLNVAMKSYGSQVELFHRHRWYLCCSTNCNVYTGTLIMVWG